MTREWNAFPAEDKSQMLVAFLSSAKGVLVCFHFLFSRAESSVICFHRTISHFTFTNDTLNFFSPEPDVKKTFFCKMSRLYLRFGALSLLFFYAQFENAPKTGGWKHTYWQSIFKNPRWPINTSRLPEQPCNWAALSNWCLFWLLRWLKCELLWQSLQLMETWVLAWAQEDRPVVLRPQHSSSESSREKAFWKGGCSCVKQGLFLHCT